MQHVNQRVAIVSIHGTPKLIFGCSEISMSAPRLTERTPLRGPSLSDSDVPVYYATQRSYTTRRRNPWGMEHSLQCCIGAAAMALFIAGTVIAVSYSIHNTEPTISTTITPPTSSTATRTTTATPRNETFQLEELNVLFGTGWTSQGGNCTEFNPTSIKEALAVGEMKLRNRDILEMAIKNKQKDPPVEVKRHRIAMHTSDRARKIAREGWKLDMATKHLINSLGCVPIPVDLTESDLCPSPSPVTCNRTRFRSADGTCNNLHSPTEWGVAFQPFRRILSPDYADGVSQPRTSIDGSPLPSAREVSLEVHRPLYSEDRHFTVMLAVWGQFMDHDVTATAISQGYEGEAIACCNSTLKHPECFPVDLKKTDPFYSRFNRTCMEFVRSAPAHLCRLGPREQMNQVSSYLDASVVYGANQEATQRLREGEGGRLSMFLTPDGRELLPIDPSPESGCNNQTEFARGRYCFLSGDARANENLHLTTLHLIMAREHNRIARILEKLNSDWDDERIFQESRRIVGAEMQHITFNEFLPIIIGRNLTKQIGLESRNQGYDFSYNSQLDASVSNVFAAAAFRFAHTLLPNLMKIATKNSSEVMELNKMLFNPYGLYDADYADATMKGAMETWLRHAGPHSSNEISGHLFAPCGLDLVSLNIQRGRDHGLQSYPYWRKKCGLSVPKSWNSLRALINSESFDAIKRIYKSPEDIDVYTGGLSEEPMKNSLLGPTFTCLISDQFVRMKRGDRFWYETSEKPQAFTLDQLQQIRKVSLAALICVNTGGSVNFIQENVMRAPSKINPKMSCLQIPKINFKPWKEQKLHFASLKNEGLSIRVWQHNKKSNDLNDIAAQILTGEIDFNNQTIWNGSLPIELPLRRTHHHHNLKLSPLERYLWLENIAWNADIEDKDGNVSQVIGNFTYKSANGHFVALVEPEMIQKNNEDDASFHSSIYLYQEKEEERHEGIRTLQEEMRRENEIHIPIILLGDFNVTQGVFIWSGRLVFGWG